MKQVAVRGVIVKGRCGACLFLDRGSGGGEVTSKGERGRQSPSASVNRGPGNVPPASWRLIQHMFCRDESVLHSPPSKLCRVRFFSVSPLAPTARQVKRTPPRARRPLSLSLVPLSLFVLGQVHSVLVPLFCVPMCAYLLTLPLPHPVRAAVLYI